MICFLDQQFICLKILLAQFMDDLRENEQGVSGIVATVILVLVAVVLAVLFWDKISELVNGWLDTITNKSKELPT